MIEQNMVGTLNNGDRVRIVANDVATSDGLPVLGLVKQDGGDNETVRSFTEAGRSAAEVVGGNSDYSIDMDSLAMPDDEVGIDPKI